MLVKRNKQKNLYVLTLLLQSLSWWWSDICMYILRIIYLFDTISLSCIIFMKECMNVFPNNGCHKNRKETVPQLSTDITRKNSFIKNLNLIDSNYHCKNCKVDWIGAGWDKISQPQKCKFYEKREPKWNT